ncbi:MAG: tRNA (guanosine(46)-N7)-methyltransferase TrmB [Nocardioidaceae bacterium]
MDRSDSTRSRRARPHTEVTADGQRLSEVLSYARRGTRLNVRQQAAWDRWQGTRWIPEEAVDADGFDLRSYFEREAPLVVEIGSGVGEATVALAAAHPTYDVLALEVWHPGVADTLHRMEQAGVDNVRLLGVDAVWTLGHLVEPDALEELWTFFPDPWPKKRHHRRRLVDADFARLAASRLRPGALWRLATDWPDYAEQMVAVLDAEPLLVNEHDGPAPRWEDRPLTRFERRGLDAGRSITDLTYRRL